jgi:hypothetical protein
LKLPTEVAHFHIMPLQLKRPKEYKRCEAEHHLNQYKLTI